MSEHGGNNHSGEETKSMQDKYAAARVEGKSQEQAKAIAGYSPKTGTSQIERLGSPVHSKIVRALEAKGIDDDFLAAEYERGIRLAGQDGAKEKDLNAHAQYLRQLGFLMGYAKQPPAVAVQINNATPTAEGVDAESTTELLRLLREEIELRRSGPVHEEHPEPANAEAHPGVVITVTEIPKPDGRGQP